ncbi:glycosyltransferase [Paenibacillus nasutitermitis]|uniref:Glycosyltransferase n=1 Tax=Paenibacillus nasutitermitis TaxID=1652958 RepID=A0A916ZBZ0_9BACL|nr:glycosyltransferase [Paenibacillus nasutitermitis]GGD87484.1 hypothetical protein GCM10010911_52390 [Paenibacillus nasutitermitis]
MKNLYEIPFDQYQRYEICSRLIRDYCNQVQNKNKKLKILDVGGFFFNEDGSPWLPAVHFLKNHEVLVIDTFEAVTENYMKSDGRDLPFKDDHFDFVISNDVFEHIPPADRATFLIELIRVSNDYVILNNPHYTTKTVSAEKMLYEFLVTALNHEHEMLGEHIKYGLPSINEVENILADHPFKYKYYFSGSIDNWIYLMMLRHELYSRGVDHETVRLFDSYTNEFHFDDEMNLVEGYRSTFIISKKQNNELLQRNFLENSEKKKSLKIELPFASVFNLYQLKKDNEHKSKLDLFYSNPEHTLDRMSRNTKIKQTFFCNSNSMHRIGVLCATYQEKISGTLKVNINETKSMKEIYNRTIQLGHVVDNEWLYFDFVPLFDSNNSEYIITIEQLSETPGVSLYYSQKNRYGQLYMNEDQITGALCLQVYVREMKLGEAYYAVQEENSNIQSVLNELKLEQMEIKQKSNLLKLENENYKKLLEKEGSIIELINNEKYGLDEKIKNLENTIEQHNIKLNEQGVAIQLKNEELSWKDTLIHEKNNELVTVFNTTSWKVTRVLRWMSAQKRTSSNKMRLIKHLLKKNGGIVKGPFVLSYKTVNAVRKEGFVGIKNRILINKAVTDNIAISPMVDSKEKRPDYFKVGSFSHGGLVLKERSQVVEIIICVHNALEDIRRCIYSIIQYTHQPYSIIVVDDGSESETKQFLEKMLSSQNISSLIRNDKAKGYTFAANQGLKASKANYVILLNSDTIVTEYWIDKMVMCAESDSSIGMVGPLSNTASWQSVPKIEQDEDWSDNELPPEISISEMGTLIERYSAHTYPRISFLNGFCLMIKREVIDRIGYFDEETFGRGYGEENDYCIRVRKQGWELAIADDVYIFHAQSKSYSHEKRKILAQQADAALINKHGHSVILEGVHKCHHDRVLEGIRARVLQMFEREQIISKGKEKWEGLSIAIVLPIIEVSGGANVIIQESKAMLEMGIDVRIINLTRHQDTFSKSYNMLLNKVPIIFADEESDIKSIVEKFDVVVATSYNSVKWLDGVESTRAYYIQDFEPYFFEINSPPYKEAWDSYQLFPDLQRVTKTEWNMKEINKQIGVGASVIGASVNLDLFRPRTRVGSEWPNRPLRIAAMIRPSTPRRNPKLTMEVLENITELHGDKIEVILFGCDTDDHGFQQLPHNFKWINAGVLASEELAWLLNEIDIFIDLSSFQAMGLTAMEAMACGAAVITPQNGGTNSFVEDQVNGLIVNTESKEECLKALKKLVDDYDFRTKLQQNAIKDICQFSVEKVVNKFLETIT